MHFPLLARVVVLWCQPGRKEEEESDGAKLMRNSCTLPDAGGLH